MFFGRKKKRRQMSEEEFEKRFGSESVVIEKTGNEASQESGFPDEEDSRGFAPGSAAASRANAPQQKAPEYPEGISNPKKLPRYVEAWGWAAASARFRGIIVLILSASMFLMSFALVVTNGMLSRVNYIVVGLDESGRPSILDRLSTSDVSPELFIRDFVNNMFNYSPSTVRSNSSRALLAATEGFFESWRHRLGSQFIESVARDEVVQVTSVAKIEIRDMKPREFTADVWTSRYRSSKVSGKTEEEKIKYEIVVFIGSPTKENPWGYYVSAIAESRYQ